MIVNNCLTLHLYMIVNMFFDRKCGSVKGFNYLSIVRSDDFFNYLTLPCSSKLTPYFQTKI